MGAGAGTLFCFAVGSEVYAITGDARSGRGRTEGWSARGAVRQGNVRLHGARVFPAVARRRAGGGAVVCKFGEWGVGVVGGRWSRVVRRSAFSVKDLTGHRLHKRKQVLRFAQDDSSSEVHVSPTRKRERYKTT